MDHATYLTALRGRLAADGCTVQDTSLGPVAAIAGYRGNFLPQMMFSRIHLFTVAAAVQDVGAFAVDDFTRRVGEYGRATKGGMRGAQSGIAAFAVLVGDRVHPDAVPAATRPAKIEFAVRTQPVVVDLSAGVVHTFRGRQFWGFALNGFLRRKLALYVPDPAQPLSHPQALDS
ncbi:MAG: levansucrase [Streptosporangiaceae bacterium]|jgi:hypothetical protein|nr:levansucrase [Streptosporangiaceae bacterium]